MNQKLMVAGFLALALLTSCITEGEAPEKRDDARKTPVESAHTGIRQHIERLRYEQGKELLATVQTIIGFKELAIDPVIEALPNEDSRTRATLVYILGFIGGPAAHRAISPLVNDKDPGVRYECAAALLQLGDWSGVPVLIDFLGSEDRRLRYKAFQALKDSTKNDFGYHFSASDSERDQAVARWRSWWEERRREIIFGMR